MGTSALQAPTPRHPAGTGGGVVSFDTRTGTVTLQASDITGLGGVLAPTPPDVFGKMMYADGSGGIFWADGGAVSSFNSRVGAVTLQSSDITGLGGILVPPPPDVFGKSLYADGSGGTFWADPTSGGGSGSGVSTFDSRDGDVVLEASDITSLGGILVPPPPDTFGDMLYADGSGGTFWGPAPSGTGGSGGVTSWNGRTGGVTLNTSDIVALGGGLVPSAVGVAFGQQLTADGSGGTFWG